MNRLRFLLFSLIFILIFGFTLILPFFKGQYIHSYFERGIFLSNLLENYKSKEGHYPGDLAKLSPDYIDNNKLNSLIKDFKYKSYNDSNNYLGSGSSDGYTYVLLLKVPNMNGPLYRFDLRNKYFYEDD